MTKELKKMIRIKGRLRKQAIKTKNWVNYKQHQREIKSSFKKAECDYIHNSITEALKIITASPSGAT